MTTDPKPEFFDPRELANDPLHRVLEAHQRRADYGYRDDDHGREYMRALRAFWEHNRLLARTEAESMPECKGVHEVHDYPYVCPYCGETVPASSEPKTP